MLRASQLRRDERAKRAHHHHDGETTHQDLCNPANLLDSQAYPTSSARHGSKCFIGAAMPMEAMHELRAEASAPDNLYGMRASVDHQPLQELPQSGNIIDERR